MAHLINKLRNVLQVYQTQSLQFESHSIVWTPHIWGGRLCCVSLWIAIKRRLASMEAYFTYVYVVWLDDKHINFSNYTLVLLISGFVTICLIWVDLFVCVFFKFIYFTLFCCYCMFGCFLSSLLCFFCFYHFFSGEFSLSSIIYLIFMH